MDTTASTIEWTVSELIKHPRVMIEVQKELENVVGKRRMVEEWDLEKLEYLNMVVKESLRLHPVVPLLIPHASMEDCIVNGYHIPKNSRIIINTLQFVGTKIFGPTRSDLFRKDLLGVTLIFADTTLS